MPIFDFRCTNCGKEFETLVMGGSPPRCPFCDSVELEKLMSTFAFRSKGGASSGTGPSAAAKCSGCAGGSCSTCH